VSYAQNINIKGDRVGGISHFALPCPLITKVSICIDKEAFMENIQFKNQKEVAFPTGVSQRRSGEGDAAAQVHSAYHTKFPS